MHRSQAKIVGTVAAGLRRIPVTAKIRLLPSRAAPVPECHQQCLHVLTGLPATDQGHHRTSHGNRGSWRSCSLWLGHLKIGCLLSEIRAQPASHKVFMAEL